MVANTNNRLAFSSTTNLSNQNRVRKSRASTQRSPAHQRRYHPARRLTIARNEAEITSVYAASADDVDDAVSAARAAFKHPSWRDLPATDRGNLMIALATLVEKHAETLATIETWDNGKPYTVALEEDLGEVAGTLRYYGGYADKIHGQVINTSPDKLAYTLREPLGVCGQIIPWNYPLAMA